MSDEIKLIIFVALSLVISGAVSFFATPLIMSFAKTVGAIDVPKDARRMHKTPIPRLGGLAIFFGFLFSVILFSDIDKPVQGMLLGSVVIVVLGVIDDIIPLRAVFKLIVQIGAALIAVLHGNVISILSNPNVFSDTMFLELGVLSVPITIIWIVAITNSVNLIDGLDGLAVGVSTIASFSLLIIAIWLPMPNIAIIMAALAGGCVGFMPFNLNPAKIFMGDTGATFLGFMLAVVSIQGLFKFYTIISFAVPFLILGLPIFDIIFSFFRRLISGKNPLKPDRSHVHHRLIDMGFNQKQSVAILYTMSAILGLSAVVMTSSGEIKAILLIVSVAAAAAIGAKVISSGSKNEPDSANTKENETTDDTDNDS